MTFCKYCGKELEENQVCDCEKAVASRQITQPAQEAAEAVATQPSSQASDKGKQIVNQVVDTAKATLKVILGILKAPATKGKAFIQEGKGNVAYTIIALQAVVASIFACAVIGKINGLIGLMASTKFSGFTAFIVTFIFSVVLTAVTTGIVWGGLKILKINLDIKKAIRIIAVRSVGVIPVILLAVILFMLNVGFGVAIFIASAILGFCFLSTALNAVEELDGNKKTYFVFVLIVLYVLVYILIANKGFTLYIPKEIKAYAGQLSSISDLLSSLGMFY